MNSIIFLLFVCLTCAERWEQVAWSGYPHRTLRYGDGYTEAAYSKGAIVWHTNETGLGVESFVQYLHKPHLELALSFHQRFTLLEYNDANNNKKLDDNEIPRGVPFSIIDKSQSSIQQGDREVLTTIMRFRPTSMENHNLQRVDIKKECTVSIELTHTTDTVARADYILTPNSMEVKITVENYIWSVSSSALAIEIVINTGTNDVQLHEKSGIYSSKLDRVEVREKDATVFGFISWKNYETGERFPLRTNTITTDNGTATTLYFTLGDSQTPSLYWTGYVGVENSAQWHSASHTEVIIFCTLLGLIFILSWTVFFVQRRRRQTYEPILVLKKEYRPHDIL